MSLVKHQVKQLPRLNVLLVDDDRTTRELSAAAIEDMGFKVTQAQDGKQGLEISQNEKFDVIFMDLEMPEMDGFEASREIRKGGKSANSCIVALSGNIEGRDVVNKCLSQGMNDCLAKPLNKEILTGRIDLWEKIKS